MRVPQEENLSLRFEDKELGEAQSGESVGRMVEGRDGGGQSLVRLAQ